MRRKSSGELENGGSPITSDSTDAYVTSTSGNPNMNDRRRTRSTMFMKMNHYFPLSFCGVSLGSVGLAGTFRAMCEQNEFPRWVPYLSTPLNAVSVVLALGLVLRAIVCHDLVAKEIRNPKSLSAYGALSMAFALIFKDLANVSGENDVAYAFAAVGVWAAALFQLIVMILFFYTSWKTGFLPEPLWFPATVSFAMTGLSGVSVNFPRWIVEITFWGSVLMTAVILPIAYVRCVTNVDDISSRPSISVLQAPMSFLTVTWFEIGGSRWIEGHDATISTLVAGSNFVFITTVICIFVRRGDIFSRVSGEFAGFTFPTVSTTRGAIMYDAYWSDRAIRDGVRVLLSVWSVTYSVLLMPMILFVILFLIYNVDRLSSSHSEKKRGIVPLTGNSLIMLSPDASSPLVEDDGMALDRSIEMSPRCE